MAERKAREGKSDRGILALVQDMMREGFGLSPETIGKLMKIIRSQGEIANMKQHVRQLSGGTYKRFNQALDMAEKDMMKAKEATGEEKEEAPKKEIKESTFLQYLLSELAETPPSGDVEDMDPDDMIKIARLKKTNPKGAMQLELKNLLMQQRETSDASKKVDLQKRIKALRDKLRQPAAE